MAWRDSGSRPSGGRGSCRAVFRAVVRLGRSLALPESCKDGAQNPPRRQACPTSVTHELSGRLSTIPARCGSTALAAALPPGKGKISFGPAPAGDYTGSKYPRETEITMMKTAEISIQQVAEAGVVGAGGAGFPTHVKLAGKADTVLINAAECEPLLHKDKEVLREYADEVIAGTAAGMRLVGASRGIVGIKGKYDDVIDLLHAEAPVEHGGCHAARRLSGRRRVHPGLRRAGPGHSAGRDSAGRRGGGDERRDRHERGGRGRPAGDREVSHRRRGGGRAGDAPRAAGRDAGRMRGRGRRADHPRRRTTWSAA